MLDNSQDVMINYMELDSEYFVIGDTAHTPLEIEVAAMTIKGGITHCRERRFGVNDKAS